MKLILSAVGNDANACEPPPVHVPRTCEDGCSDATAIVACTAAEEDCNRRPDDAAHDRVCWAGRLFAGSMIAISAAVNSTSLERTG